MACEEFQIELSAWVDGELAGIERARLEAHLQTCRECRDLLSDFRDTSSLVRELPVPRAPAFITDAAMRLVRAMPKQATSTVAGSAYWKSHLKRSWLRSAWQFFITQSFSSLTRRIVSLNVAGLLALAIGIIYLSPFRADLVDTRIQSLEVQGQLIAGAIAASETVDSDSMNLFGAGTLRSLMPGQSYGPSDDPLYGIDFPINPERVAPILRRLVSLTKTRARIYDPDGVLLVDSQDLYAPGEILRFDLPPLNAAQPGLIGRTVAKLRTWLGRGDLPLYHELGPDGGKGYEEVAKALDGQDGSKVRITGRGDVIVSVAVPVQRFRAVRGVLLLSTQGADIDNMVTGERLAILKVFLIAAAVMVVLSILLAQTVVGKTIPTGPSAAPPESTDAPVPRDDFPDQSSGR